ncbi:hypothetical protein [Sphingomonas lycopersici]|uniref:Uncharacterized protein n=1 Tax=Sphingomonas lycopersici TaxID=2951807 RepID=A0AA41ZD00_9SPHN|nr:hypothetical protein [Sphingomonas lycopersici]MCW6536881.1 hypothetical protein [Sphingomonas lycopersici]
MLEDPSTPDNDPAANKETTEDPRIFCFERPEDLTAFELSVTKLIGRLHEREQSMFVSPRNVLRMNHGRQWVHSARAPEPDTSMHSISTEWLIPFKDIADNDLGLIARSILPVSEDMSRQFAQRMYGVVSAAAESVGNVVDAKIAGSVTASLIEMMSKIELGVDREGNVSMPQIHVGPEAYDKLAKALENMEPEVAAELERLKEEKSQQALQREAERRAKFRRTED